MGGENKLPLSWLSKGERGTEVVVKNLCRDACIRVGDWFRPVVFSRDQSLFPSRTLGKVWRHSIVITGQGVPLASAEYRSGRLINTLQYTEEPITATNCLVQNVKTAKLKSVILKIQCAPELLDQLIKTHVAEPHPQNFWLSRSGVGTKSLHF